MRDGGDDWQPDWAYRPPTSTAEGRARRISGGSLDRDVRAFLDRERANSDESDSAVLRRLLDIKPASSDRSRRLLAHLSTSGFRARTDLTERYLDVLGFLYSENREDFFRRANAIVRARSRKYFAHSREVIEGSATTSQPRRIPTTPLWTETLINSEKKIGILVRILASLDYGPETTDLVTRAFVKGLPNGTRIRTDS
jgi:negative regulator of replication initiation